MNGFSHARFLQGWLTITTIVLGTILTSSIPARAGLTLTASSGTSFYGVSTTSTTAVPPSDPVFNTSNGQLLYPGGGLPQLGALLGGSPTQYSTQSTLNPQFTTNATTNPNSPIGNIPANFGIASTQIYAATSGHQGGFTTQGGVFWTVRTTIADSLGAIGGLASVSFSTASATFTNNTASAITVTPAAILNVVGTIGTNPGSYVAAGLYSSYTLANDFGGFSTTPLDSVVLAANLSGVKIAATGMLLNEFGSINVAGGKVSGTGTSFNPTPVSLLSGQSITINASLTLISDPDSSLGIVEGLPLNFPSDPNNPGQPDPSFVPMFGVFANSTPQGSVPEPSTMVLLGSGLAISGLWARLRRGRPTNKA